MTTALAAIASVLLVLAAGAGARALLGLRGEGPCAGIASAAVLGFALCGFLGPLAECLGLPVPVATVAGLALLALTALGFRRLAGTGGGGAPKPFRGPVR